MRSASATMAALLAYSHPVVTQVDAYYAGRLSYANVPIIEGTISFDDSAVAKRSLTITVPARTPTQRFDPGNDPLSPLNNYGQRLRVRTGIMMPGGSTELIDVGWFLITSWSRSEPAHTITVNGSDLATLIVDDRFGLPMSPPAGSTFASEFVRLVGNILPSWVSPDLEDRPISTGTVWDRDRDQALTDLCRSWPARWHVDDTGTVAALPPYEDITAATPVDVVYRDGIGGTLVERARDGDRDRTTNRYIVDGATGPNGQPAPHAVAEVTAAGNPIRVSGPFGRKPRFFESDLITTQAQAAATAKALLAVYQFTGRAEAVKLVPDPRIELGDVAQLYTMDGDAYVGRVTKVDLPLTGRQGTMGVTCSTFPQGLEE